MKTMSLKEEFFSRIGFKRSKGSVRTKTIVYYVCWDGDKEGGRNKSRFTFKSITDLKKQIERIDIILRKGLGRDFFIRTTFELDGKEYNYCGQPGNWD